MHASRAPHNPFHYPTFVEEGARGTQGGLLNTYIHFVPPFSIFTFRIDRNGQGTGQGPQKEKVCRKGVYGRPFAHPSLATQKAICMAGMFFERFMCSPCLAVTASGR